MDEFDEDFKGTIEDYSYYKIKAFILKQIRLAEDRGFFSKLRTSGCYSVEETIVLIEEARKEAIDTIALDQGWEETGDKYRKMYGLPMIYVK